MCRSETLCLVDWLLICFALLCSLSLAYRLILNLIKRSSTHQNATKRHLLRLYLQLSFHWTWHPWPMVISISRCIWRKEMIQTNHNFAKSCGTLPDFRKSAASGSRLEYITNCCQGDIVSLLSWKIVTVQNTCQVNTVMNFMVWNGS